MNTIAIIAAFMIGLFGISHGGVNAPIQSVDFEAQTVLTFEPDVEDVSAVTEEQMDSALKVIRARLDALGYYKADISWQEGTKMCVKLPYVIEDLSEITEIIGKKGELNFLDVDGNVVMEGTKDYIKAVTAMYGQTSNYGNSEHYVQLYFTYEGRSAFKTATENAIARSGEDGNYIVIALDEAIIANPRVSSVIDSDICIITGNFTRESTQELAALINSERLPFSLSLEE